MCAGDYDGAMTWIRTIPENEAQGELAELYAAAGHGGNVDHILKVHSLHPAGMRAHFGLYRAVMQGTDGLPRVEREMIALTVSAVNGCHY